MASTTDHSVLTYLESLCDSRGLTQTQVAAALHCNKSTISRFWSADRSKSPKTLTTERLGKFADLLHMSVAQILEGALGRHRQWDPSSEDPADCMHAVAQYESKSREVYFFETRLLSSRMTEKVQRKVFEAMYSDDSTLLANMNRAGDARRKVYTDKSRSDLSRFTVDIMLTRRYEDVVYCRGVYNSCEPEDAAEMIEYYITTCVQERGLRFAFIDERQLSGFLKRRLASIESMAVMDENVTFCRDHSEVVRWAESQDEVRRDKQLLLEIMELSSFEPSEHHVRRVLEGYLRIAEKRCAEVRNRNII